MSQDTTIEYVPDEYDFIHLYRSAAGAPMGEYVILIVKASNGVKNILLFNTDGTPHKWPDSMSEDEVKRLQAEFIRVHLGHCCPKHGCKYGEHDQCPVAMELIAPDTDECEACWEEEAINVEEWAHLTYVIHPSEIPSIWVGHCLETNVVSQGEGIEKALEMTLEAAAIVIETDKREGLDPFERMAPPEHWPPERLEQWKKIRAEKGAQATWKGFDPDTQSFVEEDAQEEDDDA